MTNYTKLFIVLGIALVGALAALMFIQPQAEDITLYRSIVDVKDIDDLEHRMDLFKEWKAKYNKKYGGIEGPLRFKVWNDNYNMVQEHNAQGLEWELEMNEFADLTNEEFTALYTGFNADDMDWEDQSHVEVLDETDIPTSINWKTKGAVTGVVNQGSCGACWSFSAAAALEGLYKIKKGSLWRLSKQQQMDCSSSYGNQGCGGGLMVNSFRYTRDKGIEKDADYPYLGRVGSCRYSSTKVLFRNTGYTQVTRNSPSALKTAVAYRPVSIGVQAAGTLQMYRGGIISSNCGTALDHAIIIVGYGTSNGVDYWLCKNSWGTSWGESGYVRIKRGTQNSGAGVCGINSAASYPTL
jgi:C1A family cysteine protease